MADHAVTLEHRIVSNTAGRCPSLAAARVLTVAECPFFGVTLAPLPLVLRLAAGVGRPALPVILAELVALLEVRGMRGCNRSGLPGWRSSSVVPGRPGIVCTGRPVGPYSDKLRGCR